MLQNLKNNTWSKGEINRDKSLKELNIDSGAKEFNEWNEDCKRKHQQQNRQKTESMVRGQNFEITLSEENKEKRVKKNKKGLCDL